MSLDFNRTLGPGTDEVEVRASRTSRIDPLASTVVAVRSAGGENWKRIRAFRSVSPSFGRNARPDTEMTASNSLPSALGCTSTRVPVRGSARPPGRSPSSAWAATGGRRQRSSTRIGEAGKALVRSGRKICRRLTAYSVSVTDRPSSGEMSRGPGPLLGRLRYQTRSPVSGGAAEGGAGSAGLTRNASYLRTVSVTTPSLVTTTGCSV